MTNDAAPIAVFDSGLGGLTVLKSLALNFPQENFIYLGDTARLPYGSKSPVTIRKYCEQIIRLLKKDFSPKAVIIACNSASSQMLEHEWEGIRIFNVIEPGAAAAMAASISGRIGILGTRATVQSGEYEKHLQIEARKSNRALQCYAQACPLLVPLAEEGWFDDPITNLIVHRYLQPIIAQGIDTLILGCTHYPILINSIRKTAGNSIQLVESGPTLVKLLQEAKLPLRAGGGESGHVRIVLTDPSERSQVLARELLKPIEVDDFSWIDLAP